jgi:hypothetical protein
MTHAAEPQERKLDVARSVSAFDFYKVSFSETNPPIKFIDEPTYDTIIF